jgi:hypothetical protein
MKILFVCLLFAAGVVIPLVGSAQNEAPKTVRFELQNKSVLFSKRTLIAYEPSQMGNSTSGLFFLPFQKKEFCFAVGTKLYFANRRQVDIVMDGRRIDTEKPFLEVSASTANQVIALP